MNSITCPDCDGCGWFHSIACTRKPGAGARVGTTPCELCIGTGSITVNEFGEREKRRADGALLRMDRMARGLSVGQEAERLGISAYKLVLQERGEENS